MPNYCSQFYEVLHEKTEFQDLLKKFFSELIYLFYQPSYVLILFLIWEELYCISSHHLLIHLSNLFVSMLRGSDLGNNNHQGIAKMDFFNGGQAIYTNMGVGNPNLRSKIASEDEIDCQPGPEWAFLVYFVILGSFSVTESCVSLVIVFKPLEYDDGVLFATSELLNVNISVFRAPYRA